ncbi:hypothetical protein GCM10022248_02890 [Nonomuraea soli]
MDAGPPSQLPAALSARVLLGVLGSLSALPTSITTATGDGQPDSGGEPDSGGAEPDSGAVDRPDPQRAPADGIARVE